MTPDRQAHCAAADDRPRARFGLGLIGLPARAGMPSAAPAHPF